VTISGGGGSGATAVAKVGESADETTYVVTDITITNPGSGYTSAPSIIFTDAFGSGAAATAHISGSVGSVSITPGSGYTLPPLISFTPSTQKGAEASASAQVDGNGAVTSVTVGNGGNHYWTSPEVTFVSSNGKNASAVAIVDGGVITGIEVIEGGSGYDGATSVTITPQDVLPVGSGAEATAVVNSGVVGSVTLQKTGGGYSSAPSIEFTNSSASATASVANGAVTGIIVNPGGSGYHPDTTVVTITGGNGDASATASVNGGVVTSVAITAGGTGYFTPPSVTITDSAGGSGAAATPVMDLTAVGRVDIGTPGNAYPAETSVSFEDPGITRDGTTAFGSETITLADTSGVLAGQQVSGTGVPEASFVVEVTANTSIRISNPATADGSGTLTFRGSGATGTVMMD
jgi:hypothetical protein